MIKRAWLCVCDECTNEWYSATVPQQCAKCKTRHWHKGQIGGWCYFAKADDSGLIKIGWSTQPNIRIKALRDPASGKLVRQILLIPGPSMTTEEAMHRHFADFRQFGEWFRLSDDQVQEASNLELLHPINGDWQSNALTCRCHLPRWMADGRSKAIVPPAAAQAGGKVAKLVPVVDRPIGKDGFPRIKCKRHADLGLYEDECTGQYCVQLRRERDARLGKG